MRASVAASVVRWRASLLSTAFIAGGKAHIKLSRMVLENRFPKNLIQVAVILDDFRDTRFETIKHVMRFRPADNLFIRCSAAQATAQGYVSSPGSNLFSTLTSAWSLSLRPLRLCARQSSSVDYLLCDLCALCGENLSFLLPFFAAFSVFARDNPQTTPA
jgi:hypothetical protein